LVAHDWPGNVRELENTIERALAVASGERIGLEDLPVDLAAVAGPRIGTDGVQLSHREYVDLARNRASREYLVALMRQFPGNVTHAATRAGTERESLHRLLKRHGIRPADFK
jgi:DNA-binding NtrC family response regulator